MHIQISKIDNRFYGKILCKYVLHNGTNKYVPNKC